MYRVLGGARNGRIMPLAHTFEHEATETAGVYKVLNINEGRRALHPSTKNDGYLISLLEELCPDPGDKIEAIDLGKQRAFPKLYLSCQYNNSALYSRMAGYKWLNENTNITQSASANGSLKQLMSLGVNAGENRIAYPYEYMYGRGVVVADTGMLGKWYKTTLLDLLSGEQPDVRFQQEVIE
jgi:hypothetical protein